MKTVCPKGRVGSNPTPSATEETVPAVGWCGFLCAPEGVRVRTGRRSAERKKGAGGTLFSPRVDPQCTITDNGNDTRKVGAFFYFKNFIFIFCINFSFRYKIYVHQSRRCFVLIQFVRGELKMSNQQNNKNNQNNQQNQQNKNNQNNSQNKNNQNNSQNKNDNNQSNY